MTADPVWMATQIAYAATCTATCFWCGLSSEDKSDPGKHYDDCDFRKIASPHYCSVCRSDFSTAPAACDCDKQVTDVQIQCSPCRGRGSWGNPQLGPFPCATCTGDGLSYEAREARAV